MRSQVRTCNDNLFHNVEKLFYKRNKEAKWQGSPVVLGLPGKSIQVRTMCVDTGDVSSEGVEESTENVVTCGSSAKNTLPNSLNVRLESEENITCVNWNELAADTRKRKSADEEISEI